MTAKNPIMHVIANEAQELLSAKNYTILDIRTPNEFNASRIKGAINIDYYDRSFIDQLMELDKEGSYFVYCRTGSRTSHSMQIFQSLGFTDIVHLYKGIVEWEGNGYSIEH